MILQNTIKILTMKPVLTFQQMKQMKNKKRMPKQLLHDEVRNAIKHKMGSQKASRANERII